MKAEFIKKLSNFWTFQHNANQLTEAFEKELDQLTTQPQPTMAAEDKGVILARHFKELNELAKPFYQCLNQVGAAMEEYRNQPIEFKHPRTEQEEADRLVVLVSSISMSSLSECKVIAQVFTSEKITSLQLRGLSTTFEEKVLTILKGM